MSLLNRIKIVGICVAFFSFFQYFSCRKAIDVGYNELVGYVFMIHSDPAMGVVGNIRFKTDFTIETVSYTGTYSIKDEPNPLYTSGSDFPKTLRIVRFEMLGRSAYEPFEGYYQGEYEQLSSGERSIEGTVYVDPEHTQSLGRFSALGNP